MKYKINDVVQIGGHIGPYRITGYKEVNSFININDNTSKDNSVFYYLNKDGEMSICREENIIGLYEEETKVESGWQELINSILNQKEIEIPQDNLTALLVSIERLKKTVEEFKQFQTEKNQNELDNYNLNKTRKKEP